MGLSFSEQRRINIEIFLKSVPFGIKNAKESNAKNRLNSDVVSKSCVLVDTIFCIEIMNKAIGSHRRDGGAEDLLW